MPVPCSPLCPAVRGAVECSGVFQNRVFGGVRAQCSNTGKSALDADTILLWGNGCDFPIAVFTSEV